MDNGVRLSKTLYRTRRHFALTFEQSQFLGFCMFGLSVVLRLVCGRCVRRGTKYSTAAEYYQPLATRWFGKGIADIGALVSVVLLFVAGAVLLYGHAFL